MATKKPHVHPAAALDRHLGGRLARRRRQRGLSPTDLDKALSAVPGTVARFESGTKSMDAVHLFALSQVLKVPVLYFFENAPFLSPSSPGNMPRTEAVEEVEKFLDAYFRIPDAKVRRDILGLLRAAADDEGRKPA